MIKRKKSLPRVFHWTLAAILGVTIFILAMTFTLTEI